MSRPVSNLRLFVAVYPPIDVARELLNRLASVDLPPRARSTPAEQVHMTLQFIGDTPGADMEAVRESVERAASGLSTFTLNVMCLIALPERGPKRLIAAETDAPPTLMELHARLAKRFARNVRARPSDRFRPHLTLCRFASPARHFTIDHAGLTETFVVDRIALMRSTLWHEGATHHEIVSVTLPPS